MQDHEEDPFLIKKSVPKANPSPSAGDVNDFHRNADTDSSVTARHHTLGSRRNQAARGDHIHDNINSKKLGHGLNLVLTGAKGGNVALTNLIAMLAKFVEFTDNTT